MLPPRTPTPPGPASGGGVPPPTGGFWAFLGGGAMARAILEGAGKGGALTLSRVVVAEPDRAKHAGLRELGCEVQTSAAEALAWLAGHEPTPGGGAVLLAVKPQAWPGLADELRALAGKASVAGRVVVSIMAGVTSRRVHEDLGRSVRVVRAMPNTAAGIRRSVTAVAPGSGAQAGDERRACELFEALGPVTLELPESMLDAFTALAGSGPAYVFYLAEAMIKAAWELGFDPETADKVVRQTIAGAAQLLLQEDRPPESLRASVTSPNGTTAAAVAVLEDAGVLDAFVRAINAGRERARELSRQAPPGGKKP